MIEYFIGILGSLTATIVIILITYFFSRKFKTKIIQFSLRLLGAGIDFIYKNHEDATEDILYEVESSKSLKMILIRGHTLTEGILTNVINNKPFKDIRVLLANPDLPTNQNQVYKRAKDLNRTNDEILPEKYIEEVRSNIKTIFRRKLNPNLKIKLYELPYLFRVYITDSVLYLSYYPINKRGKSNSIYKISRHSPLYEMINIYFNSIWVYRTTITPSINYKFKVKKLSSEFKGGKEFVLVSGPSGAGKTTLLQNISSDIIYTHVKATTRISRPGEKQCLDFYFLPTEYFDLFDYQFTYERFGAKYGIFYDQLLKGIGNDKLQIISVMDLKIIELFQREFPKCTTILINATPNILKDRLIKRDFLDLDERENELIRNSDNVVNEFNKCISLFDYVIDNSGSFEDGNEKLKLVFREIREKILKR